jgi:hypothetical protein
LEIHAIERASLMERLTEELNERHERERTELISRLTRDVGLP